MKREIIVIDDSGPDDSLTVERVPVAPPERMLAAPLPANDVDADTDEWRGTGPQRGEFEDRRAA